MNWPTLPACDMVTLYVAPEPWVDLISTLHNQPKGKYDPKSEETTSIGLWNVKVNMF